MFVTGSETLEDTEVESVEDITVEWAAFVTESEVLEGPEVGLVAFTV